ncbi:hypothetical protein CspHIS471_0109580 [Cutaneotrichosporon sp. HIS471]|nr:hypothetical protein CspHIS471_0109580 [Cutaneotrichosporon sp. HIS471]
MEDDDEFLYGDSTGPLQAPAGTTTSVQESGATASNNISASMAASLAAYGIDPSTAVAEEAPEDGGVEESDGDDDDSDSDDDVKLVFNAGAQRLDLRKPQQQTSNVIGIGKWAHTATSIAPPAASPTVNKTASKPAPDALTDYNPAPRPGAPTSTSAAGTNLHGHTALSSATAQPSDMHSHPHVTAGGQPTHAALPHSSLPPQLAPSSDFKMDPTNPTGVIPSTGTSVYDIDVAQFEGSGQMWRRPGSDISDWFNYGFDEVTYPRFLKFRQEMEQGRAALLGPMAQITPDIAQNLHVPLPPQMQQMPPQMQQQMQHMQQMQQMATLQEMMRMQGMDPAAMFGMQQGMGGDIPGMGNGVQQQEDEVTSEGQPEQPSQAQPSFPIRGGNTPVSGMVPNRGGAAIRGRGGIPVGPRGAVPAAPKNSKGRFKDKDRVTESNAAAAAASLDYGDSGPPSRDRSRSRSGSPYRQSSSRYDDTAPRERERDHRDSRSQSRYDEEGEYEDRGERSERSDRDRYGERDRYGGRERYGERDRYGERERRRSPRRHAEDEEGVWESGEEDRRRKRSRSPEEERRTTRSSKRRL